MWMNTLGACDVGEGTCRRCKRCVYSSGVMGCKCDESKCVMVVSVLECIIVVSVLVYYCSGCIFDGVDVWWMYRGTVSVVSEYYKWHCRDGGESVCCRHSEWIYLGPKVGIKYMLFY